jgi:hypothetical protein
MTSKVNYRPRKPPRQTAPARAKVSYYHVTDGEWIEVPKKNYKEQCCDCGVIHRMNFRVNVKGAIEIQTFRDGRATAGARRHFAFTQD